MTDDDLLLPRPIQVAAEIAREHAISREEFDAALASRELRSHPGGSQNAQDRNNGDYVLHSDLYAWIEQREH